MRKSGCRITSFAMMTAEAGYAQDFDNPTEFYNILRNLGAVSSSCNEQGAYGYIVKSYAKHLGGKAVISDKTTAAKSLSKNSDLSKSEKEILNLLSNSIKETYVILQTSGNGMHTMYVMRNKSLSTGTVWVADPAGGVCYKYSQLTTIKSYLDRKLTFRGVTFSRLKK